MRNVIHYNEVNEVMNCNMSVKNNITRGMGATMYCGSDRYAMVVTKVVSPKTIQVVHLLDAHEDKFITNANGIMILPKPYLEEYNNKAGYYTPITYTLRKNGRWMPKGAGLWETRSIHIGEAENYRDPSF